MRHLATADIPASSLATYPGNARRADLEPIAESLRHNGQYRAIVVRGDPTDPGAGGTILAGNHTFRAATEVLGWTNVRCEVIECDDIEARRIVLVDNRLSDQARYDQDSLVALLSQTVDEDSLAGTGWSDADLAKLLDDGLPEPGDAPISDLEALYGVTVECDDEIEQGRLLERLAGEGFRVRALVR